MDDKQHPGPIANYIEWSEHRYDPGHYLGGTLPPHLRKASLGPRARRLSGVLIGIMAVLALGSGVMTRDYGASWEGMAYAPVVVLLAAAAIRMYRSGRRR